MTQELKEEIERLKQENGILKRCLKHEQELSRKMQDRITELEDLWLLQKMQQPHFNAILRQSLN